MKKYLFCLALSLLVAWGSFAVAQDAKPSRNLSPLGFWVVESNTQTPKQSTIYFYNNQHELVYKEKVDGQRLNIARLKVQRKLKQVLETAVVAWEKDRLPREDQQLVAVALKD